MKRTSVIMLIGLTLIVAGFLTNTQAENSALEESARSGPGIPGVIVPAPSEKQTTLLSEGFEAGVMPPAGWDTISNYYYVDSTWDVAAGYQYSGTYGAVCHWIYDPTGHDEWLISPSINLTGSTSPVLSFWWQSSSVWMCDSANYTVYVLVDDNGDWADHDTIWDSQTDECSFTNWTWYQEALDLSAYTAEANVKLAWRMFGGDDADFQLDDVLVYYCGSETLPLTESFETSVPPPCWQEVQLSGTADWYQAASGTSPSCSPVDGSYLAEFNSYSSSSGSEARLITPTLDLTGVSAQVMVNFWMYHYTSGFYSGDSLFVDASEDNGSSFTTLGGWEMETVGDGWFEHTVNLPVSYSGQNDIKVALRGKSNYGYDIYVDDLEIKEIPGDDMATVSIDTPPADTTFQGGSTTTVKATVKNIGANSQNNIAVTVEIDDGSKSIIYTDTQYTGTLNQNDTEQMTFTPDWTVPDAWGTYTITVYTALGGDVDASNDTTSITVNSIPSTVTCESFEGTFPPDGWTVVNNDGGSYEWTQSSSNPHTGTYHAESRYETSSLLNDDWLITPPLLISTGDAISFWYTSSYGDDTLEVRVSTTGTGPSSFTTLLWATHITVDDVYLNQSLSLNAYDGDTIWVAFVNKGDYLWRVRLDDVCMPQIYYPPYDAATISIDNPPSTVDIGVGYTPQATVKNEGSVVASFDVICTIDGYNDTVPVASLGVGSTQQVSFASWTPLASKGTYTMTVWTELTGDIDASNDTLTQTIVSCAAYTLPYSETFDNGTWGPYGDNPPTCWTIIDNGSSGDAWNRNDWHYYAYKDDGFLEALTEKTERLRKEEPEQPFKLTQKTDAKDWWYLETKQSDNARVYWSPVETQDEWLITPTLDCSGETQVLLSFWHYYNDYSVDLDDTGFVYISTDGGSSWPYTVDTYTGVDIIGNETYDISTEAAGESQVRIAFRYVAHDDMYWKIDDVQVYEPWLHDVGANTITQPVPLIFTNYYPVGKPMNIKAEVTNFGHFAETFDVKCVCDGNEVTESMTMGAGATDTVVFTFVPPDEVTYDVTVFTMLSGDMDAANDTTSEDALFAGQIAKAYPYFADFESTKDEEDWEVGVWGVAYDFELGTPTNGPGAAYSGANAWATILNGYYNSYRQEVLISPLIDLTGADPSKITFTFQHACNFEAGYYAGYDGGVVCITWPDSTSLYFMNPVGGYPPPGAFYFGWSTFPGYGDQSLLWPDYNEVSISRTGLEYNPYYYGNIQLYPLSNTAGDIVRFMFFFYSDYTITEEGWYLDYINIFEAFPPEILFPDGDDFETDEDEYLSFEVAAYDTNWNDPLTISIVSGAEAGMTFTMSKGTHASGTFEWTPGYCFGGPTPYTVGFEVMDGTGLADTGYVTILVNDVNRAPTVATDTGGVNIVDGTFIDVEELRQILIDVTGTDPDTECVSENELVTLDYYGDVPTSKSTGAFDPGTPAPTAHGTFDWTPDCGEAGLWDIYFTATDNHTLSPSLADTIHLVINVLPDDPPSLELDDVLFVKKDTFGIHVVGTDPDDYPSELSYSLVLDPELFGDYAYGFVDNGDGTADFWFYAGPHFVPPRPHDMTFWGEFMVTDKCGLTAVDTVIFTIDEPEFTLQVKKVFAWPGQQHVRVPVFLSNPWDSVGGYDVLMEYDISAGQVVGVELCDSIFVDDPAHYGWHYSHWYYDEGLRPEYFNFTLGALSHDNYIRVTSIQDMPWPQVRVPDIPRDEQMLLFCLIYDVSPLWNGREIMFHFHTKNCGDNTLSSSDGYTVWGPDTLSGQNEFACPDRPDSLKLVHLVGGAGVGIRTITIGDINLNGIAYEVGDAILFVQYLMYGASVLIEPELQTSASDINEDGVFWTVADLVMLLNIINETETKVGMSSGKPFVVELTGSGVELTASDEVGAAYFVLKYEGEIGEPELSVDGMDFEWTAEDGELKVLVYSMESNSIPSGTHALFSVPGVTNLTAEKIEIATAGGVQADVRIYEPPKSFALYQNRPNPVKANAEIAYAIPTDSKVTLRIYDIAGNLVETLVDDWKQAGVYRATWDAKDIANGVYFYKLEAGKMNATRKLILIR